MGLPNVRSDQFGMSGGNTTTDRQSHACGQCGRTFTRPDVLQRHMKTHNGHQVGNGSGSLRAESIVDLAGLSREGSGSQAGQLETGLSGLRTPQMEWPDRTFDEGQSDVITNTDSFDLGLSMSTPTLWPSETPQLAVPHPPQSFGSLDDILGSAQPVSLGQVPDPFGSIFASIASQEQILAWGKFLLPISSDIQITACCGACKMLGPCKRLTGPFLEYHRRTQQRRWTL